MHVSGMHHISGVHLSLGTAKGSGMTLREAFYTRVSIFQHVLRAILAHE
jgi:hypothetical protein